MQRLELTLPTAAENVALDEALLEWVEEEASGREILRIWESRGPLVVAGRSTRVEQEIDVAECARREVPIVRRSSGGATIVAGPGCLMYAVLLSFEARPELRDIGRAHTFVLEKLEAAIGACGVGVERAGTSDLVIADRGSMSSEANVLRKFSGNSLRVRRTHCLYHGTLLYDFDLTLIGQCLKMPPRRPEYRAGREHGEFVTNLPIERSRLVRAIDAAFPTSGALAEAPLGRATELVEMRFGRREWTFELE
jgi:lipoate-protein ligase A